jgi:integrase/recombinase XerC
MLVIQNQKYFDEVVAFAKKNDLDEGEQNASLKNRLDYLAGYVGKNNDGADKTRVLLFRDFAPYSFEFVIEAQDARGEWSRWFNVTFPLMSAFVRARASEGAGAATINRCVIAIRLMFAFAAREGIIAEDPFEQRKYRTLKLKEPRSKPNSITLSPAQIDAFLEAADRSSPTGYASLFRLTAGSGLRIDEARHADLADIDRKRMLLTVTPKPGWTTKGYRYREVPISERTAAAVASFIAARKGVALDDKSVWRDIQRVVTEAGLRRPSMHDLRRAWASAMHKNGASLKQVSNWLGHADIATTERYIRVYETATEGHEYLPR